MNEDGAVYSSSSSKASGGDSAGGPAGEAAENAAAASPATPASTSIAPLEIAAFTYLMTSVGQCGLLFGAGELITTARDREFRAGRFQKAFDMIEGLSHQLNTEATRRQGDLRREEMQYRSGVLKMPPKEWLLRQRRATEQTQKIDRARRHFARVLDGLNILRASQE